MSQVFISYRQTDDEQRQRVRVFAERLSDSGIDVILDQFFLDENPGGPNEGWPKWSSDRALKTDYVLIIGNSEWYQCFDGTQGPGTGLGAACEAADIRTRIYKTANVIPNIRVVLLKDGDDENIPDKLSPYHRFYSERDVSNIVRWINGVIETGDIPRTSIPHNLPSLQPFFGREEELRKIADALDPESRTWGALIDGPGGMGKTSLAVRAAYDASPDRFEKIIFISLKTRELDDDGLRDLSGFLISGLAELLNELARELDRADIAKVSEAQRPRLLLDVLRGTHTLLILDNLESLIKSERDTIFTFVKKLPHGCKAILTSRGRIGSAAEELILERLSQSAALATFNKLAESNFTLAKTTDEERLELYRETGGNPLLLRWTAGQIGRGSCLTLSHAINYLRSCPEKNDPLEFIFGDLVENFSEAEMRVLCALTYFTLPAKVEHIRDLTDCDEPEVESAIRSLVNRSIVLPTEELKTFTLVPLVADFLRKKNPKVITETGDRLEKQAYALAVENGHRKHDCFPMLDAVWPTVAAALPQFLAGPTERLQTIYDALDDFLDFTGRWDEWLALSRDAESRAVAERDFKTAGWRAYDGGWVCYLRGQSAEVLTHAERVEAYWRQAQAGSREQAYLLQLRGIGFKLAKDYATAINNLKESVDLLRTLGNDGHDVAIGLNTLAGAEDEAGDFEAAERHYREALSIHKRIENVEGVAIATGNLAQMAVDRKEWVQAEALSREALLLAEKLGRQELIASDLHRVARALVGQGKKSEALRYAEQSVKIFAKLDVPDLALAREILAECET